MYRFYLSSATLAFLVPFFDPEKPLDKCNKNLSVKFGFDQFKKRAQKRLNKHFRIEYLF
jgi:hypothetical protein